MRIVLWLLALVAAPAWAQTAKEEERYLCIATASGGVSYEAASKSWTGGHFNIKDMKYTLSKQGGKWRWQRFGENSGWECAEGFNEYGLISCGLEWLNPTIFNKKTMRFRTAYLIGYTDGKDVNENTPNITIGTCSRF